MKFDLHPVVYTVTVTPGRLLDEGRESSATIHDREILLAGDIKPHDRLEALIDQLIRAREWHHGRLTRRALRGFVADLLVQLADQGGPAAVERLEPASSGGAARSVIVAVAADGHRLQCPKCDKTYVAPVWMLKHLRAAHDVLDLMHVEFPD